MEKGLDKDLGMWIKKLGTKTIIEFLGLKQMRRKTIKVSHKGV